MSGVALGAADASPGAQPGTPAPRPITLLVCALGGEGGGVLTGWVVEAARRSGYPVQATSIPGVAQRTGATTYYIEIYPVPRERLGGRSPVLCLVPMAAEVDVVLSSEAMETARAFQNGFITERTTVVTSNHRVYATLEKLALGDGRYEAGRALAAVRARARREIDFDMAAETSAAGTIVSAVMFGALVGAAVLPVSREGAEAAIRAGGKGVGASLKGFASGWQHAAAQPAATASSREAPDTAIESMPARGEPRPPAPRDDVDRVVDLGVGRCRDFLDERYARLYLDRLAGVRALDEAANGRAGELTRETARLLALWMCYEDIARVAELKTRPQRLESIRAEARAKPGEPLRVFEFFKPGYDEVADMLPPALASRLRRWAARRGRRALFERGVRIETTSLPGYAQLRLLAATRALRRRSSRYAAEQSLIERWLAALRTAGNPALALEIARTARLIKGYSDTQQRGRANFTRILETVIERSALPPAQRADAVRAAREAALAGPEEARLDRELARHGIAPREPKAVPIRFVPRRKTA